MYTYLLFITDIRHKEKIWVGFILIELAYLVAVRTRNKILEPPQGRLPNNKTNVATLKWAKLCTG